MCLSTQESRGHLWEGAGGREPDLEKMKNSGALESKERVHGGRAKHSSTLLKRRSPPAQTQLVQLVHDAPGCLWAHSSRPYSSKLPSEIVWDN